MLEQAVEKLALRREELAARRLQLEPVGAVDLGELDFAAAFGRPLHLECVAVECLRVEVALRRPGVDDFAGPLADRAEVDQLARVEFGAALAELLVELPQRRSPRVLLTLDAALGDRPGAVVASRP